ncbi:MAG: hypothetical protein LBG15_13360 [Dysgonamonadaceae bacterium]|jgi:hypothetical protein|nr:hypothetical protein [Dysgonamonadaceae bacterium]
MRGRFLDIFIETVKRLVRVFSGVPVCPNPNRRIFSNTYSDAALLQETANGDPLSPVCQTLFQLGKNNLDRFGNLPVASDTGKSPDANFAFAH